MVGRSVGVIRRDGSGDTGKKKDAPRGGRTTTMSRASRVLMNLEQKIELSLVWLFFIFHSSPLRFHQVANLLPHRSSTSHSNLSSQETVPSNSEKVSTTALDKQPASFESGSFHSFPLHTIMLRFLFHHYHFTISYLHIFLTSESSLYA